MFPALKWATKWVVRYSVIGSQARIGLVTKGTKSDLFFRLPFLQLGELRSAPGWLRSHQTLAASRAPMRSRISAVREITINNLFVFCDAVRIEQCQRLFVGFGLTCAATDRGNIFVLRNCFAPRNRDVSGAVGLPNDFRSYQIIACSETQIAQSKRASLDRIMIMRAALRGG
jgi:hypothetical protein